MRKNSDEITLALEKFSRYLSWYRGNYPVPHTKPTREDIFWSNVEFTDNCWLWKGARIVNGYGNFLFKGKYNYVHRLAYMFFVGSIPDNKWIHHLCGNNLCVNPSHLQMVDGPNDIETTTASKNTAKTHCLRGHPYDENNTYKRRGGRYCRICGRESTRKYYNRKHGIITTVYGERTLQ